MGKRPTWFSALKKAFSSSNINTSTSTSTKENNNNNKNKKGKRGGFLNHGSGESRSSFLPLFREPSSIEKILGEADNHYLFTQPRVPSSRSAPAPATITSSPQPNHTPLPNPTLTNMHPSATRIQATYRGYLARRSFRALKGLVRLQRLVKSQNVQRQTMNATKQMQLLVRVQTQIHSRRLQMLENQSYKEEPHTSLTKWTFNHLSETCKNENWDDSLLTKEQVEQSLRKKAEAAIKRERALAYAYTHQSRKADARSAQGPLDLRSNGFPRWWNWMEPAAAAAYPSEYHQSANKDARSTPSRSIIPPSQHKASPRFHGSHQNYALDSYESGTPSSSKSTIPVRGKQIYTPSRTPTPNSSVLIKYKRPSTARAATCVSDVPVNDTDSLTSCPPLSAPNYMAPTVSAKAKLRAYSNPKERIPTTPGNDSKRRFSFPLTPNFGSFKWSKGSSHDDSASQKALPKHESARSFEEFSVDSAVSMPAIGGKKPFNRFV